MKLTFTLLVFVSIQVSTLAQKRLKFEYKYNPKYEIVDSSEYKKVPWYLDKKILKKDEGIKHIPYDNINLNDGGINYKNRPFDISGNTYLTVPRKGFFIYISVDGYGLEGHAGIAFLDVRKNAVHVDGAFGMFANNKEGNYATSFQANTDEDMYYNLNDNEVKKYRQGNVAYFGYLPTEVAGRMIDASPHGIYLQVSQEEYLFKIRQLRSFFDFYVKPINKSYLLGEFQHDWRFIFDAVLKDNLQNRTLTQFDFSYKFLYPHIAFMKEFEDPRTSMFWNFSSKKNKDKQSFVNDLLEEHKEQHKLDKLNFRKKLKEKNLPLDGKVELCLISGFDGLRDVQLFTYGELDVSSYHGEVKNGKPHGEGILYCNTSYCTTTGYFPIPYIKGTFKNGKLHGKAIVGQNYNVGNNKREYHPLWIGTFDKGRVVDTVVQLDIYDNIKSVGVYKNEYLEDGTSMLYNEPDVFLLEDHSRIINQFRGVYLYKDKIHGSEIPLSGKIKTPWKESYYIENDKIVLANKHEIIKVGFKKDYSNRTYKPSGTAEVYYRDGGILKGTYHPKYAVNGKAKYYWPKYGKWYNTSVKKGKFEVSHTVKRKTSSWGPIGDFVNSTLGAIGNLADGAFNILDDAFDYATGEKDIGKLITDVVDGTVNVVLDIGGQAIALGGEIVEDSGDFMQKLGDDAEQILKDVVVAQATMNDMLIDVVDYAVPDDLEKVLSLNSKRKFSDQLRNVNRQYKEKMPQLIEGCNKVLQAGGSVLQFTGKAGQVIGYSLSNASKGFPKPWNNPKKKIHTDNGHAMITEKYFNKMIDQIVAKPIKSGDNGYIQIDKASMDFDKSTNSIFLHISKGSVGFKSGFMLTGIEVINNMTLQLIPVVKKVKGEWTIVFVPRLTFLDLKNIAPALDKTIAWVIQNEMLGDATLDMDAESILNLEIESEYLGKKTNNKFEERKIKETIVSKEASIIVNNNSLTIHFNQGLK